MGNSMTIEERLARIEADYHPPDVQWLIHLVRSLLPVVEAAEECRNAQGGKKQLIAWDKLRAALQAYRESEK